MLNGRGSAKETWHLELDLNGSGMDYEPGDALAILPTNTCAVVDTLIKAGEWSGDDVVDCPDGSQAPLHEAFHRYYDITGLTRLVVKKYGNLIQNEALIKLIEPSNRATLKDYLWGREIIDMLLQYPPNGISAQTFVGVLRKMPPRLYSIASSLKAHPDEVHLTIASVRYHSHGRDREGVCSTFIADRIDLNETMRVFTHKNKNFKLPENGDTPIIMIGPGTGIAPFRSFIEERKAMGQSGKNWLFFGDQHYTYDFLYQTEWQKYLKSGLLSRLDLAFSRDQDYKVYVQDRIMENAKEIFAWLKNGAHLYVCGDASRMAGDVHETIVKIFENQGKLPREEAEAQIKQLQKDKRYQRDVY